MIQGIHQVCDLLIRSLSREGLQAVDALSPHMAPRPGEAVAAVGLRTCESKASSMADYLGTGQDPKTLATREIYGISTQLELSLDLYAPADQGAQGCDKAMERVYEALLRPLPSGLKPEALSWEEPRWDEDTDLFLRRGSLRCSAYFLASRPEGGQLFTDFILKGVVTS